MIKSKSKCKGNIGFSSCDHHKVHNKADPEL